MRRLRAPWLTYANVMSTLAVFASLGGVSYAALKLPRNSVGAAQIKPNAITASKVKDGSLTRADFSAALARGPRGPIGPSGQAGQPGSSTGLTAATLPNPYVFLAYKSAAQTTVPGTSAVQLDSEQFDPSNSFNTAVSQFTAPVTGYYAFTGRIDVRAAADPSAQIVPILYANGSQVCYGSEIKFTGQDVTGSPLACFLRLTAGTIVSLSVYDTQADPYQAGSQHTWLSGYLVAPA